MIVKDWNDQMAMTTGIAINGTRQYAGVIENAPTECVLNLMKVDDTITAVRMRTLYHSTGNTPQLVNAMFYLEHPINDIGKFEVRQLQTGLFNVATMTIEWW